MHDSIDAASSCPYVKSPSYQLLGVLVLKGISIEVPAGSIVALLGPNGAGKTTTLRALTGLLPVHEGHITKGSIAYNDASLRDLRPHQIVNLGIAQVMEGRRIFAELTVRENLMAGGFGITRANLQIRLERAYQQFPILGDRRHQAAGLLSGGEQQMLALGRAMVSQPRLLLLDVPFLGLAPKVVAEMAKMVRAINDTGVSILLVEQNADLALSLASYGYVMENGKIVFDGQAERLRADKDIQEFYLGVGGATEQSYRNVKHYRRRKRWLS